MELAVQEAQAELEAQVSPEVEEVQDTEVDREVEAALDMVADTGVVEARDDVDHKAATVLHVHRNNISADPPMSLISQNSIESLDTHEAR